jgi:hypothetical protein
MRHLSCNKIRSKATDFCQDLLTSEEADRVRIHLAQCPSCRKAYRDTEDTLARLPQDRIKDPGPEFWDGLQAAIMHRIAQNRPAPSEAPWYKKVWEIPFQWPGSAWATALILLVLVPLMLFSLYPGRPITSLPDALLAEWNVETGHDPMFSRLEGLSNQESERLGKRVVAQLASEVTKTLHRGEEEEWSWDTAGSLESLNEQELEAIAKKLKTHYPTG